MNAATTILSATVEIRAHKLRSALTCFSLSVGVAAILYTFSQIATMHKRLNTALELAGPGRLTITRRSDHISKGLSPGLTSEDADAIRATFPSLYMVYPTIWRWSTRVRLGDFHSKEVVVLGTTPEWQRRDWVYRLEGRFLNDEDVRVAARVCVLIQPGGWVKRPYWARWFPDEDLEQLLKRKPLIGKRLLIEDHLFTVVGVLHEPPRDQDPRWFRNWYHARGGTAIVPITSYQRYLYSSNQQTIGTQADQIDVDVGDEASYGIYIRRIQGLLDTRHREDDFEVHDYRERIQGAMKRNRENALAVLVIGVVAILAGGIGIMNVTLATTFARIREIGIRRSLGATRADIVLQFVTEAMILGFAGGVCGLLPGLAAARWLAPDTEQLVMPGTGHLALALAVAVGTAIAFSFLPAWTASRFDPVEALRYE